MRTLVVLFSSLAVISAAFLRDGVLFRGQDPAVELRQSHTGASNNVIKGVYLTPFDHFSPANNLHLRLKYEVNVEFFKEGGPLFLYTEFNSALFWDMTHFGLMHDVARKLNGALISAHARYLGDNYFGDTNFQRELKHLTVDHVLADIPYLLDEVKGRLNATSSRVVAFGNRFGGAIAILARKRFPHLIDAAWSSSGLFQSAMRDTDYYEEIARQFNTYGGANCSARLSKAFQQLRQLVDDKNVDKIRQLFKIPSDEVIDLYDPQHVQYLYRVVFHVASSSIFYKDIVEGIEKKCSTLTSGSDALESLSRLLQSQLRPIFSYRSEVESTLRMLRWQTDYFFGCTQFGSGMSFVPENSTQNVFPNVLTVNYYDQWCTDIFGDRYNRTLLERASDHFNLQHGGGTQYVSNAIFSEGNMNPHRFNGISKYNPKTSKLVTTQLEGLFGDIRTNNEGDSEELKAAKRTIVETLTAYINPAEE